jgi:hypothetical protein
MTPFVVLGLPRSRTAWLARFLSYGGRVCRHEPSVAWRGLEDLRDFLATGEGAADSMLTLLWPHLRELAPEARIVAVRRSRAQVAASIERMGLAVPQRLLRRLSGALWEIEQQPDVLRVCFDRLGDEHTCRKVFEHCLGLPFDRAWWERWRHVNVQADVVARTHQVISNSAGVARLYGRFLGE